MKISEIVEYFNEAKYVLTHLDIEKHTWIYWSQKQKIPYDMQLRIQTLSNGELLASYEDAPRASGARPLRPYSIRGLSVQSAILRKPLTFHCVDCFLSYIDVISTEITPDNIMLLGTIDFRNNATGQLIQCLFRPIKGSGITGDLKDLIEIRTNDGTLPIRMDEIDWNSF